MRQRRLQRGRVLCAHGLRTRSHHERERTISNCYAIGDQSKEEGNLWLRDKIFEKAIALYDQAIQAAPFELTYSLYKNTALFELVANLVFELIHRTREFLDICQEGASNVKAAKGYVWVGLALTMLGEIDAARTVRDKALSIDPFCRWSPPS